MSCNSCGSSADCDAATEAPTASGLLATCQGHCARGEVMAETEELLETFNALGFAVARGRARSLEALATVFNRLGAQPFTEVCAALLRLDCGGDLVALAYAACDADPARLHRRLVEDQQALDQLVEEVNQAARRYEWVPGNKRLGRCRLPTQQRTVPTAPEPEPVPEPEPAVGSAGAVITEAELEDWWWVGPWVGGGVLAWTAVMWWMHWRSPAAPSSPPTLTASNWRWNRSPHPIAMGSN